MIKNKYIINYNPFLKYNSIPFSFENHINSILTIDERLIIKPVFVYDKPLNNREKIKKDLKDFSGIDL
jgi:hypothetical protein